MPISRTPARSSRSSTTPLWDPRATLDIASDHRCVGHAPSKGRKCRIWLAGHNVHKADDILRNLSTQEPELGALRIHLSRLAGYLLCPRWHQDQVSSMVDKWEERIKYAYP
ncbi:hypothetical protein K458DRAFT_315897, partial [Lentithecium fluviatile CBS 122367]